MVVSLSQHFLQFISKYVILETVACFSTYSFSPVLFEQWHERCNEQLAYFTFVSLSNISQELSARNEHKVFLAYGGRFSNRQFCT